MTRASQLFSQTGTSPLSITDIALSSVLSLLEEIHRPAVAESAAGYSIEFAVLTPNDGRREHLNDEDLSYLSRLFGQIGIEPKQIAVQRHAVKFNKHHIHDSLDGPTANQRLHTYSVADLGFSIYWTWDPVPCSTRGLLWYGNKEGERELRSILESLSRLSRTHSHGILPALSVLQTENTEMRVWIHKQAEELVNLQIRTGHHHYSYYPLSNEETGSSRGLQTPDLANMSKRVCGLAVNITTSALCLQRIVQFADFILEEAVQGMKIQESSVADSVREQHSLDSASSIIQRTRSAKREAEGLLAEAEAWKHKATIMVQTLLSLTAQQDQNISISIAEDSRTLARKATRDSKSMKAIAAVTMCFLPGTFVSSLFAMPMFDWNAGSGRSVNRRFWIYWVVTLPLTMVVIAVWLAWTNSDLLRTIRKRKGRRPKAGDKTS